MEIEAIPTEYAGVVFRSKLEATWARFFDVIGLEWEYEPVMLDGWLPDFRLGGRWLAEVKPLPILWARDTSDPVLQKAIRPFETVLLGDGPNLALGLLVRRFADGSVVSRYLLADIENGPATLIAVPVWPVGVQCPLTQIWRGVVDSSASWQAVPFRKAVLTAYDAMMQPEGSGK